MQRKTFWLMLLVLLASCGLARAMVSNIVAYDAGFLGARWVDLNGDLRTRVMGPFFEKAISTNGQTLKALRPLYSVTVDPRKNRTRSEVLWPLADYRRLMNEANLRVLLTYYQDTDCTDPKAKYHCWVIPFYFQGRDAQTNRYMALFPIGGQVRDFLSYDRINFALFPLWVYSTKMQSTNQAVLWPIFSRTDGGGIESRRVFPLWGHSKYWNESERGFVLWPIYTWATEYRKGLAGHGYMVFPLWGRVNTELEQSWYAVPPFFRYSKGKNGKVLHAPWPFIRWATGDVNQLAFFPIWGYRAFGNVHNEFFLWPIVRYQRTDRWYVTKKRLVVLPFYMGETYEPRTPKAQSGRYTMIWPLMSYRREGAVRRIRLLELWPLKNTGSVERNWTPFWTFFNHLSSPEGVDSEVLWGLYRHHRRETNYLYSSVFPLYSWERSEAPEPHREWNLLKGLIGYERQGKQRTLRVLYFMRFKL